MKCPKCSSKQRRRDGMSCARCRYAFIFDPKVDHVTDGRFAAVILKANGNRTRAFTVNQLYGVWSATPHRHVGRIAIGAFLLFGAVVAVASGAAGLFVLLGLLALIVFATAVPKGIPHRAGGIRLWMLLTFELWRSIVIDGEPP